MILRLEPDVPVVWRTPQTLQLGVDRVLAVLEDVDHVDETLITVLRHGVARPGLDLIARRLGAGSDRVDTLLNAVGPALARPAPPARAPSTIAIEGSGPVADAIRRVLVADHRNLVGSHPDSGADQAVLVGSWALLPTAAGAWLRRDIPHLPVVTGDHEVRVGPLVIPGASSCERCLALWRAEGDPAWPAMAAQLCGRPAPSLSADVLALVAALAVRALLHLPAPGALGLAIVVDTGTGAISERPTRQHPECGCRALPGSETESAIRSDGPIRTTNSVAIAVVPG